MSREYRKKKTNQSTRQKDAIPFQNFTIYSGKDTTLVLETGTEVFIPKNAFLDIDDNPITGTVDLKYREFHSAASIALAEIPMEIDKKTMLLSGGMFEINGTQKENNIKVNPNKPLKVDLATNAKEDRYNHYFLNPETNKWEDKGDLSIDTTSMADKISPEIEWWKFTEDFTDKTGYFRKRGNGESIALAVKEDQGRKFRKWAKNPKGESTGYFYSLYSTRHSPNAKYRYLAWYLTGTNYPETVDQFVTLHDRKHEASHSFWNSLNVVKCENEFQLHYSNGSQDLVVNATPDMKSYPGDNNFLKSQKRHDQKLIKRINRIQKSLFNEAKGNIKTTIKGKSQKELNSFVRSRAIKLSDVEQLLAGRKFRLSNPKTPYKSTISVKTFGVHNIDAPVSYFAYGAANILTSPVWLFKGAYNVYAKGTKKRFVKKRRWGIPYLKGEPRTHETIDKITLIQKGINTSREFTSDKLRKFEYSSAYDNLGIVFLKDGTHRIIPPQQFKGYTRESSSFMFESIEVSSTLELKKEIKKLGFEI